MGSRRLERHGKSLERGAGSLGKSLGKSVDEEQNQSLQIIDAQPVPPPVPPPVPLCAPVPPPVVTQKGRLQKLPGVKTVWPWWNTQFPPRPNTSNSNHSFK